MSERNLQPLKGFRDFLPQTMAIRSQTIKVLKEVFEGFGFAELQTPALEYQEVLLGKYGQEAEKLMYLFNDSGQRAVGLKYDLTVPLARVMGGNLNLPLPFKRYQIQPVWRADKPQKGRYREIYQCDVDIVGTKSTVADAEIIAVIYTALKKLSLGQFKIFINTRPLLFALMKQVGIPENKWKETAISIDKLDKKGEFEVREELMRERGIDKGCIDELFRTATQLKEAFPDAKPLIEEDRLLASFPVIRDNINYLKGVAIYANLLGVPTDSMIPLFTLARGLDYYTGTIFETFVTEPKIGSLTGGGRFDELMQKLSGRNLPAVGTTIGLDRIVDVIEELNLWPQFKPVVTKVLIATFTFELRSESLKLAKILRENGVNVETYLDFEVSPDKQLKYADKKGIQYVLIIKQEEFGEGKVILKDLTTGDQQFIGVDQIVSMLAKRSSES